MVRRIYLEHRYVSRAYLTPAQLENSRLSGWRVYDAQDKARPYDGFAFFKVDFPAIEACTGSDKYARPSEAKADVRVCVYLFEELGAREEL